MRHASADNEPVKNSPLSVTALFKICTQCERLSKKVREVWEKEENPGRNVGVPARYSGLKLRRGLFSSQDSAVRVNFSGSLSLACTRPRARDSSNTDFVLVYEP